MLGQRRATPLRGISKNYFIIVSTVQVLVFYFKGVYYLAKIIINLVSFNIQIKSS